MKLLGACLVLAAGYLAGLCLMEPARRHLAFLEEGEYLLQLLESELREERLPLPELFALLGSHSTGEWSAFFLELSQTLRGREDRQLFALWEQTLQSTTSGILRKEEQALFAQAGKCLFSADRHFHENTLEGLSRRLQEHNNALRHSLQEKNKVCRAMCLSLSALLIIILI